jgi:acyl-CoA synthetase (AMP-forming)/AMP-acid ligase II
MKQSSRPIPTSHAAPCTLVDLLQSRTEQYPDRLAYRFIQDGETEIISITYGDLDRQAEAMGAWLKTSGARDYIASFTCGGYKP